MSATEPIDRGPLDEFEIVWKSGHIERVKAHQCILPHDGLFGSPRTRITFHGEIDGRWRLILDAPGAAIDSVRNITQTSNQPS